MAKIAVISCNDRCCMGARQLSSLVKGRHKFYLVRYGKYHHPTFSDTARIGDEGDERLLLGLLRDLSGPCGILIPLGAGKAGYPPCGENPVRTRPARDDGQHRRHF